MAPHMHSSRGLQRSVMWRRQRNAARGRPWLRRSLASSSSHGARTLALKPPRPLLSAQPRTPLRPSSPLSGRHEDAGPSVSGTTRSEAVLPPQPRCRPTRRRRRPSPPAAPHWRRSAGGERRQSPSCLEPWRTTQRWRVATCGCRNSARGCGGRLICGSTRRAASGRRRRHASRRLLQS